MWIRIVLDLGSCVGGAAATMDAEEESTGAGACAGGVEEVGTGFAVTMFAATVGCGASTGADGCGARTSCWCW